MGAVKALSPHRKQDCCAPSGIRFHLDVEWRIGTFQHHSYACARHRLLIPVAYYLDFYFRLARNNRRRHARETYFDREGLGRAASGCCGRPGNRSGSCIQLQRTRSQQLDYIAVLVFYTPSNPWCIGGRRKLVVGAGAAVDNAPLQIHGSLDCPALLAEILSLYVEDAIGYANVGIEPKNHEDSPFASPGEKTFENSRSIFDRLDAHRYYNSGSKND